MKKRRHRFLVGFSGDGNCVYGLEHQQLDSRWEQPLTRSQALRMKRRIDKSNAEVVCHPKVRVFELVKVTP